MPQSVGVRWMSPPSASVARLAAKSSAKSVAVTTGWSWPGMTPAHRRPQPGEQLVHPEGLGDVVVGAGVERLYFGELGVAGRQHDDGHARPGPEGAEDVDATHARQAEVE